MKDIKIVICGGHFSPALAVIEKLKEEKKYFQVYYVGRVKPLEGDNSFSLEYLELSRSEISLYTIDSGRFPRELSLSSVISLARFPQGLFQSFFLLSKIHPQVVLSFGGYIALPICLAAYALRIPIFTHEQTAILGLANRIIARFAKVLFLTYKDTEKIPPGVKTVVAGNPLRLSITSSSQSSFIKSQDAGAQFTNFGDQSLPLIYVTGGSLGARPINKIIGKIIPQLVQKYRVLHQTGAAYNLVDFYSLLKVKASLPKAVQVNYKLVKHVPSKHVGAILKTAKFVIGRSGANTVSELAYLSTPAILIPLPHAADNEQYVNARMLEKEGSAKVINQHGLTAKKLLREIVNFEKNYTVYKKNARRAKNILSNSAEEKIINEIERYLS